MKPKPRKHIPSVKDYQDELNHVLHPILQQFETWKENNVKIEIKNGHQEITVPSIGFSMGGMRAGDPRIEAILAMSFIQSKEFSRKCPTEFGVRIPELEQFLINDPWTAATYAIEILKHRWVKAEHIIVTNSGASMYYHNHIMTDRWPEAEEAMLRNIALYDIDVYDLGQYANKYFHGHWQEAEDRVCNSRSPEEIFTYARVVKHRLREAERTILTEPDIAAKYAVVVIGKRWPAFEEKYMPFQPASDPGDQETGFDTEDEWHSNDATGAINYYRSHFHGST